MAAINATAATAAYRATLASPASAAADGAGPAGPSPSVGAVLRRAFEGVVDAGHAADLASARAVTGAGNVTEVVTAISKAELALQATVAIRDRVISAYQEVMRMPI